MSYGRVNYGRATEEQRYYQHTYKEKVVFFEKVHYSVSSVLTGLLFLVFLEEVSELSAVLRFIREALDAEVLWDKVLF